MTRHETLDVPSIADKDLVLATDLDGTFLGGTDTEREAFYGFIEGNRHRIGLIFVTGRDPGHITQLVRKQGVPRPDFVVGDVGTTIAAFGSDNLLAPIEELEAEIAEAWGDAGARVQASLHPMAGLTLQSTGFRYRVSYDMDPDSFDQRALDVVGDMGLDALVSDNRYFDVLPKDVSKGPSLLRLLTHLGVANDRVLVAGDTLNDVSMMTLGLPAVAVGNSEPALVDRVRDLDHVFLAPGHGVTGIADAIVARKIFTA